MEFQSSECYDCYQVKIQVNLSEEDSCLYQRCGKNFFSVEKVEVDNPFDNCKDAKKRCEPDQKKLVGDNQYVVEVKSPDALILNVELDKCDCTKAVFTIHVRLPHDPKFSDESDRLFAEVKDDDAKNDLPPAPGYGNSMFKSKFMSCKYNLKSGCMSQVRDVKSNCGSQGKYIMTFEVHPLNYNVVSSGVIDKCCSYEVSRVYCYDAVNMGSTVCCPDEIVKAKIAAPGREPQPQPQPAELCDRVLKLAFGTDANVLRIIFPMTKELKCLVPDFRIGGTLVNAVVGNICKVMVRLVSTGPCPFVYPAFLTYNMEDCTVCLEIQEFTEEEYCEAIRGYEYQYGAKGCQKFLKNQNYVSPLNLRDERAGLFDQLAYANKINVMGVAKCTEVSLFSFQVCLDLQKRQLYDLCGNPIMLIPSRGIKRHTLYDDPYVMVAKSHSVEGQKLLSSNPGEVRPPDADWDWEPLSPDSDADWDIKVSNLIDSSPAPSYRVQSSAPDFCYEFAAVLKKSFKVATSTSDFPKTTESPKTADSPV